MGNNKLQTGKFIDEECKQVDDIFMAVARNYRDLAYQESIISGAKYKLCILSMQPCSIKTERPKSVNVEVCDIMPPRAKFPTMSIQCKTIHNPTRLLK